MTVEEFAKKFGLSIKSTLHYLKDNSPNGRIVIQGGRRTLVFDEKDIDEVALLRIKNHHPFDPETEHDRMSIDQALKARGISQPNRDAFMRHPKLPLMKRIRPPNHRIYDKQEVDEFIESYFGKTGGIVSRKREIKGIAASWIFANRGQFWRIGDTITTRIMHGKEV